MRLWMNNVGIIKDSSVLIDGLTVITGKNSSGKTTVGKVLYAIIQANSDIEKAFEHSKAAYISSQLGRIWTALSALRNYPIRLPQAIREMSDVEQILFVLSRRRYGSVPLDQQITWLYSVKDILPRLTIQELGSFIEKYYSSPLDREKEYYLTISEQFEERKRSALEICSRAIATIDDPRAFQTFRSERTKAFLNSAFRNQIKPIKAARSVAQIRLDSSDRTILGLKIHGKSNFEFSNDSSFVFPYNQAIFVDNPFVLDRIEDDAFFYPAVHQDTTDDMISVVNVLSHEDHLIGLLTTMASSNFFDNLEFQKKYQSIVEKINAIVPGEFQKASDGMFYVENGMKLNIQNLATGSKLFSILKLLFMKGCLNRDTVLVLDEPESHLHPDWINKFAEILVLLIKEVKLHILLTTHSPNLLLALHVYAKSYEVAHLSHFYLAKTMENGWSASLSCIDENINEGYAHLSIPLISMTIQQDSLTEE